MGWALKFNTPGIPCHICHNPEGCHPHGPTVSNHRDVTAHRVSLTPQRHRPSACGLSFSVSPHTETSHSNRRHGFSALACCTRQSPSCHNGFSSVSHVSTPGTRGASSCLGHTQHHTVGLALTQVGSGSRPVGAGHGYGSHHWASRQFLSQTHPV